MSRLATLLTGLVIVAALVAACSDDGDGRNGDDIGDAGDEYQSWIEDGRQAGYSESELACAWQALRETRTPFDLIFVGNLFGGAGILSALDRLEEQKVAECGDFR